MTLNKQSGDKYKPYIIIFSIAIIVYGLIYLFTGNFFITASNPYNSYSRQAAAWLSGQLDLGENVPWLELAVFNGKYYVSFPPFPSIVLLPFVLIFGISTPDNTIAFIISLLSLFYAYKLGYKVLRNKWHSVFLSLFLILGTNYLHVSLWGSVWYIAQNMAFLFTLIAFYYALSYNSKHSFIALFAMCAAMGCRPFNALYLPLVLYLIFLRENKSFVSYLKNVLIYSIPAFVLGVFFMWLNYARFGSIFEFGHNYLPEFLSDPHGQFYAGRILANLERIFFNFDIFEFPMFHGFAFWVASPIVVSFIIYLGLYIVKSVRGTVLVTPCQRDGSCDTKSAKYIVIGILVLTMAHILLFSLHRTLGGHQFGSRYTVDTLPAFYLGLLLLVNSLKIKNSIYFNAVPMLFGFVLNFYGTVQFMSYYY